MINPMVRRFAPLIIKKVLIIVRDDFHLKGIKLMSRHEDLKPSVGRIDIKSGIDLTAVQIEAAKKMLAAGPIE